MSELNHYYNTFRLTVRCKGSECRGWHLSEVDTWHECPCNKVKGRPHPEVDDGLEGYEGYVVSYREGGHIIYTTYDLEHAKEVARSYRDKGYDVRLHKAYEH